VAGTLSDLRRNAEWDLNRTKRENADPKEIAKLQDAYNKASRDEDSAMGKKEVTPSIPLYQPLSRRQQVGRHCATF